MLTSKRWAILMALMVILAMVLSHIPISAVNAQEAEVTTIVWSYWGDPGEDKVNRTLIAAFEEEHPEIKIDVIWEPWSTYFDKIETMWAGGESPDVLFLSWVPTYASKGVLEPLDPWIEKSGYDLSDYWPGVLEAMRYNGKLYGLTRDADMKILYYNKKLFDEAGVSYPDETWTWDTFMEAAEKLTKKDASGRVTQFALGMEGFWWAIWAGQKGHWLLDDVHNPSKCDLDNPEAVEAIGWFGDLMNKYQYAMRSAALDQAGGDAEVFNTGQVAMIIQNASRIPTFNANPDLDYAIGPIPVPKDGQRANNSVGAGYCMGAASEHKEEAWTFLSWLQGKGGQTMFAETGTMFPALRSVAESDVFLAPPPGGKEAFLLEAQHVRPMWGMFPEFAEMMDTLVVPNLDLIWVGDKTADEIVPLMCQEIDEFLEEYGYPK